MPGRTSGRGRGGVAALLDVEVAEEAVEATVMPLQVLSRIKDCAQPLRIMFLITVRRVQQTKCEPLGRR